MVRFSNIILAATCAATLMAAPAHAQSDLARAYRIIASKQLVDLTHSFSPTTPVWSGFRARLGSIFGAGLKKVSLQPARSLWPLPDNFRANGTSRPASQILPWTIPGI